MRETPSVHIEVEVDGRCMQAAVGRAILDRSYGPCMRAQDYVEVVRLHQHLVNDAVARRARSSGLRAVLLSYGELMQPPVTG